MSFDNKRNPASGKACCMNVAKREIQLTKLQKAS